MLTENTSKNDKVKALLEQASEGAKEVFTSERYINYLSTMSKFHQYSFRNILLIYLQNPDASLVAGYRAWQDKFGRQVKKGEKGIKILGFTPYKKEITVETGEKDENGEPKTEVVEKEIPAFTPVSVFDISQTEGKELSLTTDLTVQVENSEKFISALVEVSTVPVEFEDIKRYGVKGFFSPQDSKIIVRSELPAAQTIKTLVHEITHSELHNDADPDLIRDRHTEEIEAESTAFVVCSHFGIDTSEYSFPYLAAWSKNHDLKEMENSLNVIQNQASSLISRIEKALGLDVKKEVVKNEPKQLLPAEIRENKENNRLQIIFSEKPSKYILAELKKNGFHWASKEKAWQRPLNAESNEIAKTLIEKIEKSDNDISQDSIKADTVVTNVGHIPIEDYREIQALQNGFDSYEDMYEQGYRLGNGYDIEPTQKTNKPELSLEEKYNVNLVATYEDLTNVPVQDRTTDYFGDLSLHHFIIGVTEEQIQPIYQKALEAIQMTEAEFKDNQDLNLFRGKIEDRMRDCLFSENMDFKNSLEQLKSIKNKVSQILISLPQTSGLCEENTELHKLSISEAKTAFLHNLPVGVVDNGYFKFVPLESNLDEIYTNGKHLVFSPFLPEEDLNYLQSSLQLFAQISTDLKHTKEFSFAASIVKDFVNEPFASPSTTFTMTVNLAEKLNKKDTEYIKDFVDFYVGEVAPKDREAILSKYIAFLNRLSEVAASSSFKSKLSEAQKKSELTHSPIRKERKECLQSKS